MIPIRNAVPSRYPPAITWMLIAINCLVFLFQDSLRPDELELFVGQFALIPARYFDVLTSGGTHLAAVDILPFFTMMFLHGGWPHLILNMWTLWLFGPTVEDRLGHGRYLAFYLVCGLAASVAHVMFNPESVIPALGASGAIAGILGCYMRLFPMARVVVLVPILFIPLFFEVYAFVFIGLWFLLQLLQSMMELLLPFPSGDIAWWAHVGGFIAGFTLGPLLARSEQRYRAYYPDEGVLGFDTQGRT
jgi:membrane associated rhomboid family serine protease